MFGSRINYFYFWGKNYVFAPNFLFNYKSLFSMETDNKQIIKYFLPFSFIINILFL